MPLTLSLKKMSRTDKLRAMEALWSDLSRDEDKFESPAWHADALRAAEREIETGKAAFSDWDDVKKRLRRRAARAG
jgi:N-acetyl-beta-hexosaminidase